MRKGIVLLSGLSLLVPLGIWAAAPASGVTPTKLPTCKSLQGTQTYNPGLPKLGVTTTVKPLTTTKLTITGCTGGGIASGASNSAVKATKGTNCNMLVANANKPGAPTTGVIKWLNAAKATVATSTTKNILTVTSKPGATPIKAKLVSTYTQGLGKGHVTTTLLTATPNAGFCTKTAFTKSTFKSTKITTK